MSEETEAARARLRTHPRGVHVEIALTPRRASTFWVLLPQRVRMPLLMWWVMRDQRRQARNFHSTWLAGQYPLLTTRSRKRVAKLLRREWDHTGVRFLGVPKGEYLLYAEQLIMCVPVRSGEHGDADPALIDAFVAERMAEIEAHLGLRDSPLPHRLMLAAKVREVLERDGA